MTISEVLRKSPAPFKGFVIDVVQYPTHHALRIYSSNLEEFSEMQKALLLEWLNDKLVIINSFTKCSLEKEAVMP